MRIAIITNVDNGKGLQRETALLTSMMEPMGCHVTPLHFVKARTPPRGAFDLAVFLEVAPERFFDCAQVRWLIPNPEWWEPSARIDPFDRVLCKTGDAERIFRQRPDAADRVRFLGFEAQSRRAVADPDQAIATRPDLPLRFLHFAGGSALKGTSAVVEAWERFGIPHPLTIATSIPGFRAPPLATVTVHLGRIPEGRLIDLQRSHRVHLQPSEYEGFGHCIHEGLSVGACVITTDAEPMRSADGVAELVRVHASHPLKSARLWKVSPEAVRDVVERVSVRTPGWFEDVRIGAIRGFEAQRAVFRERLAGFLGEVGT